MELDLNGFWRLPPISRNVATFTFLLSLGFWSGLVDGSSFFYYPPAVWKFPPQLWRLFTGFCITGKDLSIIFDTYFLYSYMSQLETGHPRTAKTEDMLWYLTFVGGTILVGLSHYPVYIHHCLEPYFAHAACTPSLRETNPLISARIVSVPLQLSRFLELRKITPALRPSIIRKTRIGCGVGMVGCLNGWLLTWLQALTHLVASPGGLYIHPLLVALAYTITQQQQGMKAHYIILSFPAPLMPYIMIASNLIRQGGLDAAWFDAQGLIAAHLFEFLTKIWPEIGGGTNWIPTPYFYPSIVTFFAGLGSRAARVTERSYGSMISPAGGSSGSSSGVDTGPLPDSWRTRGGGRRLG
ncbi:hypothetical protein Golomagni_06561 [Golovinomyces magnicellulatus]|nr:hypothetical protein Golomagni_06561 [Golovinomyces magnicellulatus]